jgi:putative ABC transport system ATP-binding protein
VVNLDDSELSVYRNSKIGFVFQLFNLLPREDVFHNVELPLLYGRMKKQQRRMRVEEVLSSVGLLDRMRHKPNELSGGERQRVAIARALANYPSLILADEPTGNLDLSSGHQIMEVFSKLNEEGNTIILVTHNEEMAKYAKQKIRLRDGEIEG